MAFMLEANINVLWQNLIALNSSILRENEEQRAELLQTKELLQKETEHSKILQEKNAAQQQKMARLCSKMVAVQQLVSFESVDDDIVTVSATNQPVIMKVESVESASSSATEYDDTNSVLLPVDVCNECDKKFCSSSSLKRHMMLHEIPTYQCPKCPQKFARKDYVQRHYKRVHRNDGRVSTQSDISIRQARHTRSNNATL